MDISSLFQCTMAHIMRILCAFTQTLKATTAVAVVYSPFLHALHASYCAPAFQQMLAGCRPILCIISQPLSRIGDA